MGASALITDCADTRLWNTPFSTLGGKTPRQWLAPEGSGGFMFHAYVKGTYGVRLMENLLPWLNFGADNMNPELLEYWRTRGIEKHRHANAEDPDRTWFAYLPIHRTKPDKPLPVWYINHVKNRDILDTEAWGVVRYVAQRQILVITAEDGNSEQIFQETLQAAEALYPVDKSRIYLVGHSLSGSCAGRLAVAFPEQLAGLCMLGSQYGGQNSTLDQAANIRCCQMPRIDIHGLAEHILPYNKTLGPTSPQVYSNITPTDMGLDASFSEQQFWRDVNHCRPITREEMADIDTTSADPVERKLGIPVDKSRVFALGSVRHFVGDILSEDGRLAMRVIGVEGAPHYPSAYAGMLALDYLSQFSRAPGTGLLEFTPQQEEVQIDAI